MVAASLFISDIVSGRLSTTRTAASMLLPINMPKNMCHSETIIAVIINN